MSPLVCAQSPLHHTWSTMTHCCGLHLVEKESAMTTFEATFTTALGGAAVFTNLFWERCRKQRVMSVLSALCLLVSTDTISWGYLGKASRKKVAVLLDFVQMRGEGGGPAQFFCPLLISAFSVNKRSLFPPECQ